MTPEQLLKRYPLIAGDPYFDNKNCETKEDLVKVVEQGIADICHQWSPPKPKGEVGATVKLYTGDREYNLGRWTLQKRIQTTNGWRTDTTFFTQSNIQTRHPELMQGELGRLLGLRKSLSEATRPRKSKASKALVLDETETPTRQQQRKTRRPAPYEPRFVKAKSEEAQTESARDGINGADATVLRVKSKGLRVVLAEHKQELGRHGIEKGSSLEVVYRGEKTWMTATWMTPIPAREGEMILLRPLGVTNTPGWEFDVEFL
ncbi:hypothetical protein BDP27DRAFT_1430194 [Rhodocollybia butyracea]|uniref:Uncharacterized protein n=1 Tax=Rhodocollybia butyracea TaxID=206335 RepID=A0A9P5P8Q3_9AGAR|nr:hypothetical protein BDP27DRAFT_1430194 [Rhodocollybia butyracea]